MAYKIGLTLGCRHFQIIVYRNTIYEIFHYISIDKIKKNHLNTRQTANPENALRLRNAANVTISIFSLTYFKILYFSCDLKQKTEF